MDAVSQRLRRLLIATAALVVALTMVRAAVFWRNEAYLDDASGHLTALAKDVTQGVFYRPLRSEAGYGGTRHLPLRFTVHAALMKVVGDPIQSGFVVSGAAMLLLTLGVYVLLRRQGVAVAVAASCAAFVLAAHPAQEALLTIKSDGLAAALNVWGVALCAGTAVGGGALVASAIAFSLAFATKVTAVSGAAATILWLGCSGRTRAAAKLLLAVGIGMGAVLGLTGLLSHGTVFEIFRASASGGARTADVIAAPLTLARQARRVPETLVFIQLGCAALLVLAARGREILTSLPGWLFVCVMGVTAVIFGSPGTDTNHLLDLHVASVILVGVWMTRRERLVSEFAAAALTVAALAASLSLGSGLANRRSEQRRGLIADTLKLIPDKTRPILAQNPLVPVVAGQRAFLLDPFLIRVIAEREPGFADPLWDDMRHQRFAAVVLELDARNERSQVLYREALLGERFMEELQRNYEPSASVGLRTIYLPRSQP
jgi:hypothetical protein